jgi:DNA repair exonuclease SbcCD ATPase subunit
MKFKTMWLTLSLTAAAACALAQPRPAPTLTTDEIIHSRIAPPAPSRPAAAGGGEARSQPSDDAAQLTPEQRERKTAEREWNERLRQARERLNDLQRRADAHELQINRLRNAQFDPTRPQPPEAGGRISAQIAELAAQVKALRAEAKDAEQAVNELLAEGEQKRFEVEAVELEKKDGSPNRAGYRKRFAELKRELDDATARAQVLQLRINDIYWERRRNENGDNFRLNRLRDEQAEAAAELERTKARIAELTQEIAQLERQAALVGIAPGELR